MHKCRIRLCRSPAKRNSKSHVRPFPGCLEVTRRMQVFRQLSISPNAYDAIIGPSARKCGGRHPTLAYKSIIVAPPCFQLVFSGTGLPSTKNNTGASEPLFTGRVYIPFITVVLPWITPLICASTKTPSGASCPSMQAWPTKIWGGSWRICFPRGTSSTTTTGSE